jgi:hypothetical protein
MRTPPWVPYSSELFISSKLNRPLRLSFFSNYDKSTLQGRPRLLELQMIVRFDSIIDDTILLLTQPQFAECLIVAYSIEIL